MPAFGTLPRADREVILACVCTAMLVHHDDDPEMRNSLVFSKRINARDFNDVDVPQLPAGGFVGINDILSILQSFRVTKRQRQERVNVKVDIDAKVVSERTRG